MVLVPATKGLGAPGPAFNRASTRWQPCSSEQHGQLHGSLEDGPQESSQGCYWRRHKRKPVEGCRPPGTPFITRAAPGPSWDGRALQSLGRLASCSWARHGPKQASFRRPCRPRTCVREGGVSRCLHKASAAPFRRPSHHLPRPGSAHPRTELSSRSDMSNASTNATASRRIVRSCSARRSRTACAWLLRK